MINLQQYIDLYGAARLGGGRSYYLIGHDEPHSINSRSGGAGLVTNEDGRVQEYDLSTDDAEPSPEEVLLLNLEDLTPEQEDRLGDLVVERMDSKLWWAETPDKYYLWPYHPDRKVVAYKLHKEIPSDDGVVLPGAVFELVGGLVVHGSCFYRASKLASMPQYFQPLYELPELPLVERPERVVWTP